MRIKASLFMLSMITGFFLFTHASAQSLHLKTDNPKDVSYSAYEPFLNQYVQADLTLGETEVFQTKEQWEQQDFIISSLQPHTIYTFLSRAKGENEQVTDFSDGSTFVYQICEMPSLDEQTPIVISINPKNNPPHTRYAIYVPQREEYVQLDGSFAKEIAWLTLDQWSINGYITITEPNAHQYSYQIKARSSAGQETPFSEKKYVSSCSEIENIQAHIAAYTSTPSDNTGYPKTFLKSLHKVIFTLLLLTLLIAFISFIVYLRHFYACKQHKRPSKLLKKQTALAFQFLVYTIGVIGLICIFFFIMALTSWIYHARLPEKMTWSTLNVQTLPEGQSLLYVLKLKNISSSELTMYQPLPVLAGYVHESLSANGKNQTDALDDDLLAFDPVTHQIRIDLKKAQTDSLIITFQVQK